jgi:hypothetical protein
VTEQRDAVTAAEDMGVVAVVVCAMAVDIAVAALEGTAETTAA